MSGLTAGLLLALLSSVSTAFAHAFLKVAGDKLAVQAWIRLIGFALAAPVAVWLGPPPLSLVPWIIGAAAIHAIYQVTLNWSYSLTDFSTAYPLARGATPLFTTAIGIAVLGDYASPLLLIGVTLVSVGVLLLAYHGQVTRAGLLAAGLAALLTTAYTIIDAHGVRLAEMPLLFIAWFYLADGVSMPIMLIIRRRRDSYAALRREWRTGSRAGVMSLFAFVPALFALGLAPVGAVSALRETSVLIGLALGGAMLKERLDCYRISAALLIMAGSLAIIVQAA